jgi:hypothetical protein
LIGLAATMVIAVGLAMQGALGRSAGFGAGGWTSMVYLRTQAGVIVHYVRLAFWPQPLVFQYGWLPAESWRSVWPQVVLLAVRGACDGCRAHPSANRFGLGAWFFDPAPSSSIVPVRLKRPPNTGYLACCDHHGCCRRTLCIIGCAAPESDGFGPLLSVPLVLTCAVLGVATHDRNKVMPVPRPLPPMLFRIARETQAQLTVAVPGGRRFAEAEPHLRQAIALPLPPSTPEAARSLAHFIFAWHCVAAEVRSRGEPSSDFRAADFDRAYPILAEAQLSLKRADAAVRHVRSRLARRPDDVALVKRLAWIFATSSNARCETVPVPCSRLSVPRPAGSRDPVAPRRAGGRARGSGVGRRARRAAAPPTGSHERPADFVPTLRAHLALFEAKRPVRSEGW